ncbi:twin-arginine translocase TatA/TatE family subunit [Kribbella deserti]|uniref:Twin-arginine translocase TatA/TatE family subunit n=1 Tax=Kribbella deserti TaxID=1926257 RepID=A0ABV6QRC6_9ACTN
MTSLITMPSGAEWLIVLAIVVLLFGSTKLPTLVRQLGKSKKIWEEEVGTGKKKGDAELTQGVQTPEQTINPPVQAPSQQPQPNTQVNGQGPGDGVPPSHTAN